MRRDSLAPAVIASIVLHLVLFGFALWRWPTQTRDLIASAVPVQIVSSVPASTAPTPNPPEPEAVEEPAPQPEPTPPPPAPAPPQPAPTPAPTTTPKPAPTPKPTPKPQEKGLDLDALTASLSKGAKPAKPSTPKPAAGAPAPNRAPVISGAALSALQGKLDQYWNPNCGVAGADKVVVTVAFELTSQRTLRGAPTLVSPRSDPVWLAAADRARSAVIQAGQRGAFADLPPELLNQQIKANFRGDQRCG
jgi:outer membrane biosynthesis protein TonB